MSVAVSDIFGVSAARCSPPSSPGERDPKALAEMACGTMRRKIPMLEEAFTGHFTDHHAFLLAKMLTRVDELDADITDLDSRIEAEIAPFR